ncbi:chemotaxis protein CheX [Cohnella sp. CFH 77786]|uniref:chemotaxis protein CheX n=1 Tax=Cohnella sp. CFH 77786 TaxID=2662265 RepID=UPI001C60CEC0|nr:chemotaxis protein CheX [Cohnella sp. CFH 77786]
MEEWHLKPFQESANNVFGMFQLSPQIGSPSKRETAFTGNEILTVIGVTGDLRGQVYLGMSTAAAMNIASVMMGGAAIAEFDAMAQSAVSELGNMICGNAAIALYSKEGLSLDITPPTLVAGSGMEVSAVKMNVVSIPIHLEGMDGMEMNLALEAGRNEG